jgi:hypothetical protein
MKASAIPHMVFDKRLAIVQGYAVLGSLQREMYGMLV